MNLIWGAILTIFTLILCWLGQVLSATSPARAVQLGLMEDESEVDPVYYADGRGEAQWDAAILWVLPVAGILLVFNHPWWAYFGLVGGGILTFSSSRLISTFR